MKLSHRFHMRSLRGIGILLILTGFGYVGCIVHNLTPSTNPITQYKHTKFLVRVDEIKSMDAGSIRTYSTIIGRVDDQNRTHPVEYPCLLMVYDSCLQLQAGQSFMVVGAVREIEPPRSKSDFNYKFYLENRGIRGQIHLKAHQMIRISNVAASPLNNWMIQCRLRFSGTVDELYNETEHRAMLKALFIGDQLWLSKNLKQSFIETGTIHVLAISGLHTGIIYIILIQLLAPLGKIRWGRFINLISILLALWAFAVITGLQASVVRSVLMFSMLQIGKTLNRSGAALNSLSAAGFLMLMFDPCELWTIGFQFSFLAVAGILIWYRAIRSFFLPESFLMAKITDLMVVSFCAQLAILPLSLLYFHQFAWHFLLTNLIVVPCITFIMYAAIVSILLIKISVLASVAAWISGISIEFVSWVVTKFSGNERFMLTFTHFDKVDAVLFYLTLWALSKWVMVNRSGSLWRALLLMVIWAGLGVWRNI